MKRYAVLFASHTLVFSQFASVGVAQPKKAEPPLPASLEAEAQRSTSQALSFLASRQGADGGWTEQYGPAITAIVARAFAQDARYGPKHPIVRRAVASILRHEQTDGGIYDRRQNLANYQTSVALMLLASLDDSALEPRIAKAQVFLAGLQYDPAESIDTAHHWYGGAGYGKTKRPDLSNTQMMLEALHASGLPKDHPVYQRALAFVSRCQMNDETNDLPFADGATDGGFIYSPNAKGESKASENLQEGTAPLRSYGSMTYSGFKSLLYAGAGRDDPRIKATLNWIRRNYTLEQNPGMPPAQKYQGLYYYYQVFAKALQVWGEPVLTDSAGRKHNWRIDLCRKLIGLQRPDGSWVNSEADRWLENDANYVTALAVISLQAALER